jgi:hypothetical protein
MDLELGGWLGGWCFDAYGLRLGVRTNDPEVLDAIPRLARPGWRINVEAAEVDRLYSLVAQPGKHQVYTGKAPTRKRWQARFGELTEALDVLLMDMEEYVAEYARGWVFVHAGVVGWHGTAILLPGASFAGKSTLVAALVRAGAAYYSDEFAILDPDGWVHPYPRPIHLRTPSGAPGETCDAYALGGVAGSEPLPVGLVAITSHNPRASWQPHRLSPGRGVLALLCNTIPARRRPRAVLDALCKVVASAPVLEGERGEAAETAERLLHANREQLGHSAADHIASEPLACALNR